MDKNLFQFYSIDECVNDVLLYEELDKFKGDGKLEYKKQDKYVIKITDISLDEADVTHLIGLFDSLELVPYLGYENPELLEEDNNSDDENGEEFSDWHESYDF